MVSVCLFYTFFGLRQNSRPWQAPDVAFCYGSAEERFTVSTPNKISHICWPGQTFLIGHLLVSISTARLKGFNLCGSAAFHIQYININKHTFRSREYVSVQIRLIHIWLKPKLHCWNYRQTKEISICFVELPYSLHMRGLRPCDPSLSYFFFPVILKRL